MNFNEQYNEYLAVINKSLDGIIQEKDNLQKDIYKAMRYSLLAGGKRIRPILLLAASEVLDLNKKELIPFACAIEMIHTYSLIHDDLPAMDNDDLRRGKKTCHIEFSEALAILAGDALLNKAFEIMGKQALKMDDPVRGIRMMNQISTMAGTEGMIGGQVIDIQSEGKEVSESVIRDIYIKKTAALLKAPILVAIEAKDCMEDEIADILIEYVEIIGLAFQVKDDILDEIGEVSTLGKNIGRDAEIKKANFVSIYGLEYCKDLLKELTDRAISAASSLGEKGEFLKDLAYYLLERDN